MLLSFLRPRTGTSHGDRARELHEADFYAWARDQAAALRRLAAERWNGPLDLANLAEAAENLGKSERDAVRSQVRRIIEHCLKLEFCPAADPRIGWSTVSGPAPVNIDHPDRLVATPRPSPSPRTYMLRLMVSDGQLTGSDETTVVVR